MLFADFRPQGRKQAQELWNNLIPIGLAAQIGILPVFRAQLLSRTAKRSAQRVNPI